MDVARVEDAAAEKGRGEEQGSQDAEYEERADGGSDPEPAPLACRSQSGEILLRFRRAPPAREAHRRFGYGTLLAMRPAPHLSVVLACYNEEEILAASFTEIREVLEDLGRPYEIVFVDDVSRDRTRDVIRDIVAAHPAAPIQVILHDVNRGRGTTVSDGFRAARGEIVGYLDVDLEVHARYIPSLVRAIEKGAEVATVRRIYAFQLRSLDRYFMSRGYSYLVRKMLGTSLHDTETGYKFFRREALMPVLEEIRDPGWFWDTEFMVRAERRGLRVAEVPGAYVRRFDKTSTVRGLRDSARYFGKLLAFRRELRDGRP
jgi:glycosyltransferase involved in cell wall biosynthesis